MEVWNPQYLQLIICNQLWVMGQHVPCVNMHLQDRLSESSFITCRFFPVWQWWWHRTGRCLRLRWGRAPPTVKTHSLLWSSYALVPPLAAAPGVPRGPRCFSQAPSRGCWLTLRWGEVWELHPAGCGCSRWVWWGWWSLRCWGCLFWMPAPHLMGAKEDETVIIHFKGLHF